MFQANIVPGQGFVPCVVYAKKGGVTESGRAVKAGYRMTEKQFFGIVVEANQKEIDQWKQNGHPITHKIIQYGGDISAKATDYIKVADCINYYVQGARNPAGLKVTNIYYVESRTDIKEELD